MTYDKSIALQDGEYIPVVRIDAEIMFLPAQLTLRHAQKVLAEFPPDDTDERGCVIGPAVNYSYCSSDWFQIKLAMEDAEEGNVEAW